MGVAVCRSLAAPWDRQLVQCCALGGALLLLGPGCSGDEGDGVGGHGGAGATQVCSGGPGGGGGGAGAVDEPRPEDIGFEAVGPVPAGEQILFNDWNVPDSVYSMDPDGVNTVEVFRAYRVWSMGVSRGGDRLAFACGDPLQEDHYGVALGDAIQHTWIYDISSQTVEVLAYGNLNDECHEFAPGDRGIYVCRRYDFVQLGPTDFDNHTYRLGRIDLPSKCFSFVTDDVAPVMQLHPQPSPDDAQLLYSEVEWAGTSQTRRIVQMSLPAGPPAVVREDAHRPVLSPDGTRYLYADTAAGGSIYSSDLAGTDAVLVANRPGSGMRYSPDGTRVAYLVYDDTSACSDVETVAADGTQADSPVVIRDCSETGEFITELAWFVRP